MIALEAGDNLPREWREGETCRPAGKRNQHCCEMLKQIPYP